MIREIARGVLFTVASMVLVGAYHVVLWGVGRVAFAEQAEGSLVRRADGRIVGSRLIAQEFTRPEYLRSRPSAAGYNAASTGGSNYGPSNADHLEAVQARLDAIVKEEGVPAGHVPSEMVTASGAGMDPHIPPAAAELQVARIAASRNVDAAKVRDVIAAHTQAPTWGFLGRARVSVLEANMALDQAFGAPAGARENTDVH